VLERAKQSKRLVFESSIPLTQQHGRSSDSVVPHSTTRAEVSVNVYVDLSPLCPHHHHHHHHHQQALRWTGCNQVQRSQDEMYVLERDLGLYPQKQHHFFLSEVRYVLERAAVCVTNFKVRALVRVSSSWSAPAVARPTDCA
jgi:hypothetical protein